MKPLMEGQPVLPLPPTDPRFLDGAPVAQVPDVVGQPENDARAILQKAGRIVSVETTDNAADRGTVVGQNPQGQALPGETILLTVSSGNAPDAPDAPGDGGGDNGGGGNGNGRGGGDNGNGGGGGNGRGGGGN